MSDKRQDNESMAAYSRAIHFLPVGFLKSFPVMTGGVKLAAKGFKGHSHHGVSFGTDTVPVPLLRSLTFSAVQRWEAWATSKKLIQLPKYAFLK
jgi:hypothetical protein